MAARHLVKKTSNSTQREAISLKYQVLSPETAFIGVVKEDGKDETVIPIEVDIKLPVPEPEADMSWSGPMRRRSIRPMAMMKTSHRRGGSRRRGRSGGYRSRSASWGGSNKMMMKNAVVFGLPKRKRMKKMIKPRIQYADMSVAVESMPPPLVAKKLTETEKKTRSEAAAKEAERRKKEAEKRA